MLRAVQIVIAAAPLAAILLMIGGCSHEQAVLAPRSAGAERTAALSWLLLIGATAIFVVVMTLAVLSLAGGPAVRAFLARPTTIFSGGVIFPLVTLTALLAYGLTLIRAEPDAERPLQIDVVGERWWWRVSYPQGGGRALHSANELRVPVGRPVRLKLTTADVIHSFWVPQVAGKVDMIPGRTNVLDFRVTSPGSFRGQCAEYCGGAHALMGLRIVALEPDKFASWLEGERARAREPESAAAVRGKELFLQRGCPACHAVTGTSAVGIMGPNLTHVAGRAALAAERLPMSKENLERWIRHADKFKPGTLMPSFAGLPEAETDAIAAYLATLE